MSALLGSVVTTLVFGVLLTVRRLRSRAGSADDGLGESDLAGDRPPPDYAAKTPEGFSGMKWGPPPDPH